MTNQNITTKVYLIRHGITDWIEQGILHGRSDRPLSAFGLEQAELTGKAMKDCQAARLFTSPLLRALQTAEPISRETGLKPEPIEDLQEMYFGILEGKRDYWPVLKDKKVLVMIYYAWRLLLATISGESQRHFRQRVLRAWAEIRSQADGQPIIVVAHSGVLRTILLHEFGGRFTDATRFVLNACSISEIEISPQAPSRIVHINGIAHLNGKVSL